MKLLIALITILTFSGCKNNNCCTLISLDVNLEVQSSAGLDLLDPQNGNSFTQNNIDVFYLKEGTFVKVYDASKDFPKGIQIYKEGAGKNVLRLFANTSTDHMNNSITLIKFGNTQADTLKAQLQKDGTSITISKAWINGVLIDRNKHFILNK